MEGHILSVETMGLRDGPGIRFVVFFAGCRLRCRFCHNPDSWAPGGKDTVTPEELFRRILRFRPYFSRSGGGVTFSGGEPLLQPDFLLRMLSLCKQEGIHTCLDTAGVGVGRYREILSLTDLVLYDVKETDPGRYLALTGTPIAETEAFLAALRACPRPTVVRAVILPGYNDTPDYMAQLRTYIREKLPPVREVELLPYHRMGAYKYAALGMDEPLGDTPPMDPLKTQALARQFFSDFSSEEGVLS